MKGGYLGITSGYIAGIVKKSKANIWCLGLRAWVT